MHYQASDEERAGLCRQAPEFLAVAEQVALPEFDYDGDLFQALVQNIVSQQLAVRAAEVIYGRVAGLLGEINVDNLLAADPVALRACGLSGRKVSYLQGIAEAVRAGSIDFAGLAGRADADIIAELVKLKGVGVWTAEMLLIFALGRRDVLSYSDLGIRRGIMHLYGLETLTEVEFAAYRHRYAPHGTLASFYLWRIKDSARAAAPPAKPKRRSANGDA